MLPIIPVVVVSIASIFLWYKIRKLFKNKKALLTGPLSSGKTTFLQYISKDVIPDGASGAPRSYEVDKAVFDEATDFSGAEAWLRTKFDDYIKSHDYILFFFDVSEYIKDNHYREDVNSRIDMIYRVKTSSQTSLLVGTHIDKVSGDYRAKIESFFADKSYQSMLNKIAYVDTTKKKCVKTIINELTK